MGNTHIIWTVHFLPHHILATLDISILLFQDNYLPRRIIILYNISLYQPPHSLALLSRWVRQNNWLTTSRTISLMFHPSTPPPILHHLRSVSCPVLLVYRLHSHSIVNLQAERLQCHWEVVIVQDNTCFSLYLSRLLPAPAVSTTTIKDPLPWLLPLSLTTSRYPHLTRSIVDLYHQKRQCLSHTLPLLLLLVVPNLHSLSNTTDCGPVEPPVPGPASIYLTDKESLSLLFSFPF